MSVIIRLQNLPWSANALDIRQFFQGLSIPDGGVHIVGGEMGDAFIAFSTDEDARQAMQLDRGKLKEVQIRLLLSSRAEMQKVIETARQQSLAMMQAAVQQQQQQPQPPIISKLQQVPQPPVITPTSLNKILYQPLPQSINENSVISLQSYVNDNSMDSRDSKDANSDRSGNYRGRERDRFARSSRSRSKSRERRRSRDRGDRRRRDRSRSKSRERRDRRRGRRSDSSDREYTRTESRTNDRNNQKDRDRTSSNTPDKNNTQIPSTGVIGVTGTVPALGTIGLWNTSPTQPGFQANLTKGYSTVNTPGNAASAAFQANQTMYNLLQKAPQQQQQPKQEQLRLQQPIFSSNMQLSLSKSQDPTSGENKPIYNYQSFFKSNNSGALTTGDNISGASKSIAFQNPYTQASAPGSNKSNELKNTSNTFSGIFGRTNDAKRETSEGLASPPSRTQQAEVKKPQEINYDELVGNCIKISNMCPSTSYSELRKFFSGLYIANNGIKMINDQNGIRIGVAYVRFVKSESKPKAFARNGAMLKDKQISIESVTEQDFESAVDSYKPTKRFGGRFDDDRKDFLFGGRNHDDNTFRRNGDLKDLERTGFNNLILEDVPVFAKEQDIMKMFSSYTLTDIILTNDTENRKQLLCYVKFHRAEDAKKALEESGTHVIGHKKVFVSPCTNERFDKAKELYSMQGIEEVEANDNDGESDTQEKILEIIDDSEEQPNSNKMTGNIEEPIINDENDDSVVNEVKNESISNDSTVNTNVPSIFNLGGGPPNTEGPTDPRKRSRQGSRFSRPEDNQNNTNYALIKNCDYKSTKQNFVQFFARAGIPPVRVEICMNSRNQPSGECICEFSSSADAERALFQSNYYLGNRCVRIELISPQEVAKRLGDRFVEQSSSREDTNMNVNSSPIQMGNMSDMNNPMGNMGNMGGMGMNNMGNMNGLNQMTPNMMMNNPGLGMNNFNQNMMNFRSNPFTGNNGGGGGGFNDNFDNFKNFSPTHDNPFRVGNNMSPGGGNMGPGPNNDRFNKNRNNRGSRNARQSRFSDFDDKGANANNMNKMNMPGNMGNNLGNDMGNMGMMGCDPPMPQDVLGDTSVDQFGQPGCVIGMENVPYKATIEDIMEFFKAYNIQPHNVIRRYNDDGTPTGDARVAFSSPMQARAALESKRHQKILNRTIYLTII